MNTGSFTPKLQENVSKGGGPLLMEHHGFTVYVDTSDVISSAENFYAAIRYPVLIDPQLTFSPADVLVEIHPELVPNFFQGSQVLVSGRYTNPSSNIMMSLSGIAFSRPIADDYFFTLSDTAATQNQFLMKIWAKQKIESLLTQYYLHPDDAVLQQELQNQMVWLSVNYGVISPFTSMGPPSTPTSLADDHSDSPKLAQDFELFGNYPNPYNASTTIQFKINQNLSDAVTVNIYNTLGQLVRVLTLQVNHSGTYGLIWDGLTSSGLAAPSGTYIYTVTFGNTVLGGQMSMIK